VTDELVVYEGRGAFLVGMAALGAVALAVLVVSAVVLLFNLDRGSEWTAAIVLPICGLAAILIAGLTLRLVRAARQHGPVLTVTAEGIRDGSLIAGTIPWDQIEYLTWHWWYGKNSAVVLKPGAPYLVGIGLADRATALLGRLMFMPGFGLMVGPAPDGHARLVAAVRRFRPDLVRAS
jgi:hypothetical protein